MFNRQIMKKPVKELTLSPEYKETIRTSSYIGSKGYTILKAKLTPADLRELKVVLTLSPYQLPAFSGGNDVQIPVFQEGETKLYVPRHFGIERYGLPTTNHVPLGEIIAEQCVFTKTLRENQVPVVRAFMENVESGGFGGTCQLPCAFGKTILAIYLISMVRKKTLVLVHKEFLMNQWIERIREFLPMARIGRIQGMECDIDNKDIVLGMIQSVYRRNYNYSSFGFTIIDECHRIASEEFSKTLLQVSTRIMLGISATLDRKDGLTKLITMFFGETLYSITSREKNDKVLVRALTFEHENREYNKEEFDERTGYPRYSSMISKLCNFEPRGEFIVGVLRDLLEEDPEAQILVLVHNICLLDYLFENITFATSGFYKGGMKKRALKESESKQIILASFSMSSEGLDIRSLNVLVLATPKTEITQSVGRVLRSVDGTPKIIDIVDTHGVFQNQFKKRLAYYKKCGYTIEKGTSLANCEPIGKKRFHTSEEEEDDDIPVPMVCNVVLDDDY
jgi:superfamily II DNA or RNA helicase